MRQQSGGQVRQVKWRSSKASSGGQVRQQTLPVILELQGEGWHWKHLRLKTRSVQAQDQGDCNNEMAALPQVCVLLHLTIAYYFN